MRSYGVESCADSWEMRLDSWKQWANLLIKSPKLRDDSHLDLARYCANSRLYLGAL